MPEFHAAAFRNESGVPVSDPVKVMVFPVGSMTKVIAALAGRARNNAAVRQREMFFIRMYGNAFFLTNAEKRCTDHVP